MRNSDFVWHDNVQNLLQPDFRGELHPFTSFMGFFGQELQLMATLGGKCFFGVCTTSRSKKKMSKSKARSKKKMSNKDEVKNKWVTLKFFWKIVESPTKVLKTHRNHSQTTVMNSNPLVCWLIPPECTQNPVFWVHLELLPQFPPKKFSLTLFFWPHSFVSHFVWPHPCY